MCYFLILDMCGLMPDSAVQLSIKPALTLAQLKPVPGERVRLETRIPRARYSVRFIGLHEGGGVLVTSPKPGVGRTLPNEGASLTVKLAAGNHICAFQARLLKVQYLPFPHWVLEYPTQIDVRKLRAHTRVPVNLMVTVDNETSDNGFPISVFCHDICLKGASLEAGRMLGNPGEKLFITTRVSVAGLDHVMLIPAVLRSVYQRESGPAGVFRHGVEFFDLEEETRLVLAGFVYQQCLFESGYLEEYES